MKGVESGGVELAFYLLIVIAMITLLFLIVFLYLGPAMGITKPAITGEESAEAVTEQFKTPIVLKHGITIEGEGERFIMGPGNPLIIEKQDDKIIISGLSGGSVGP